MSVSNNTSLSSVNSTGLLAQNLIETNLESIRKKPNDFPLGYLVPFADSYGPTSQVSEEVKWQIYFAALSYKDVNEIPHIGYFSVEHLNTPDLIALYRILHAFYDQVKEPVLENHLFLIEDRIFRLYRNGRFSDQAIIDNLQKYSDKALGIIRLELELKCLYPSYREKIIQLFSLCKQKFGQTNYLTSIQLTRKIVEAYFISETHSQHLEDTDYNSIIKISDLSSIYSQEWIVRSLVENTEILHFLVGNTPEFICHFKWSTLASEEVRIRVAKIFLEKNPHMCAWIFKEFTIQSEQIRFEFAKIIAEKTPSKCAECFKNFDLLNEQFRVDIAKIILEKDYDQFILNFGNFALQSEQAQIEVAKAFAEINPDKFLRSLYLFNIQSEQALIDIAKIVLNKNPATCAYYFESFAIQDEQVRIDFAKMIADKDPRACAEYFRKFTITSEKVRLEIALILAEKDPAACLSQFENFNIKTEQSRFDFTKILAEKNPLWCAHYFKNLDLQTEQFRFEIVKFLVEKNPQISAACFRNFDLQTKQFRDEIILILVEKSPSVCATYKDQLSLTEAELMVLLLKSETFINQPALFFKLEVSTESKKKLFEIFIQLVLNGYDKDLIKVLWDIPNEVYPSSEELEEIKQRFPENHSFPILLKDIITWKEELTKLEINRDRMVVKLLVIPPLDDLDMSFQEVKIKLIRFINLLNTVDEQNPFYREPASLLGDGGQKITKNQLRGYLLKLLTSIERKNADVAVPAGEDRDKYYDTLGRMLASTSLRLDEMVEVQEDGKYKIRQQQDMTTQDTGVVFTESIYQIALAGNHCGTRWREAIFKIFKAVNKIEDGTPQEQVEQACADFRLAIANKMYPNDIHGFGQFMKNLGPSLQIPGHEIADEVLGGWSEYNEERNLAKFYSFYTTPEVIRYFIGKYQGEPAFKAFLEKEFGKIIGVVKKETIDENCGPILENQRFAEVVASWHQMLSDPSIVVPETSYSRYLDAIRQEIYKIPLQEPFEDAMETFLKEKFAIQTPPDIQTLRDESKTRQLTPQESRKLIAFMQQKSKVNEDIEAFIRQLKDRPILEALIEARKELTSVAKLGKLKAVSRDFKVQDFLIRQAMKFAQDNYIDVSRLEVESLFVSLKAAGDTSVQTIEQKLSAFIRNGVIMDYLPEFKESLKASPILVERSIAALLVHYQTFSIA